MIKFWLSIQIKSRLFIKQ